VALTAGEHPIRLALYVTLILAAAGLAIPARADPGVTVKSLHINIDVQANGSEVQSFHIERIPMNPATVARLGQWAVQFNPATEQVDIIEAYTLKQDGTRKPVDPASIRSQLMPGQVSAPIYQDLWQKVLIFPDLAPGDTEVLSYRRNVIRPPFPGTFFWADNFNGAVNWIDNQIVVTAPAGEKLQTEGHGLDWSQTTENGRTTYRTHYAAQGSDGPEASGISPWDRRHRVFISSFPDYAALAAAFQALAEPKEAVTPRIQALADKLTKGITDRRAQAAALHVWVSQNIRYVGIDLGTGAIEPHAADEVLGNGYGDCKDHVTLLAALLKAKGIQSQAALINLGDAYTLSGPPTLAQLNHVITWLPEFGVYTDSTAAVAPFAVLPFEEYGKPVVLTGMPAAKTRQQTPILTEADVTMRTETHASLEEPNGRIVGTTTTIATGPPALAVRMFARTADLEGAEDLARRQLQSFDEEGHGTFVVNPIPASGPTATLTGNFLLQDRPDILDGEPFVLPVGLPVLRRPGDFLLGLLSLADMGDEIATPCYAGHQIEDLTLVLPPGRKPMKLPVDRKIDGEMFSYQSHWSVVDHTVSVHREFISRIDQPVCSGALRRDIVAAQREIQRDERKRIWLDEPP
jgi:transglutaminase-like putative cysteine protease